MSRTLTAATLSELLAAAKSPVLFYEGDFATGTLRFWTGYAPVTWNGQTWTGVGNLVSLSPIAEVEGEKARGLSCSLTGIDAAILSTALQDVRRHKAGKIWLGFLDAAGAVIADPVLAFWGRLDVAAIDEGAETATVTVTYENRLIDLERPRIRRWTDQDQQIDYPGDKGFEFVTSVQEWNGKWGAA